MIWAIKSSSLELDLISSMAPCMSSISQPCLASNIVTMAVKNLSSIVKAPFIRFGTLIIAKGAFRVNAQKLKAKNENSKPF